MPNEFVKKVAEEKYKFGFTTDIQTEIIDKGLNEDVVRLISQKKGEETAAEREQGNRPGTDEDLRQAGNTA